METNHRQKHLAFIATTIDTAGHAIEADGCVRGLTADQQQRLFDLSERCKIIARELRELSYAIAIAHGDGGAA